MDCVHHIWCPLFSQEFQDLPDGAETTLTDILRNDVCDISLNLQLTERVLVSTDGSVSSVEAVAEPDEPEEMWTVKRG